jgi:hypothetical protein
MYSELNVTAPCGCEITLEVDIATCYGHDPGEYCYCYDVNQTTVESVSLKHVEGCTWNAK